MKTVDLKTLSDRHSQMVKYQKKIAPFTPTIRELMKLWDMRTTSHVNQALERMLEYGMLKTRAAGSATKYYAIEDK